MNFEKDASALLPLWQEQFSAIAPDILNSIFERALHTCKFFPKIAEILEPLQRSAETARPLAAEREWERVLDLRRLHWNPDIPADHSRRMALLPERVQQAARAAGLFRDFATVQDLHVWAKKRFLESYAAYEELERDQFLLPAGELRGLLSDAAEMKSLPPPETWEAMRGRGVVYAAELKSAPRETLQADPPRSHICARPARSIEEQKRILRERGFAV